MSKRPFGAPGFHLRPFDAARAARTLGSLAQAGQVVPSDRPLLEAAFGNSPYLARIALREPEFLLGLLDNGPDVALADIRAGAERAAALPAAEAVMAALRTAKRRAALSIALADISGSWPLERTTAALSEFADACLGAALRFLFGQCAAGTPHTALSGEELEAQTGLVVLAMGKLGARELNYSSDIDLIVFYDAERFPFRKRGDSRAAAVDIVKGLVRLLSETTADGYVFRVDLRLRPDAGATQIAISTEAAEDYYESMGQNWERAALIKARACAGDPIAASRFLKRIEPFVWRRNLDYAAIDDIHSIKRQIHAHAGHGAVAVGGHNVKLGRGGIREIEFFVQTQQLILGGRDPDLRAASTLTALDGLRRRGLVSNEAAADLKAAYEFLRQLEHRLQAIDDEQTHAVPKSAEGLAHIACFLGFDSAEAFGAPLKRHLETVQRHYARLFERAPPLAFASGNLVFTGVEDDPDTLETLAGIGFRDVRHVAEAVRGWHHGRIRATRSARARELLTKLIPELLRTLGATSDPDSAFAQFDRFLSHLPAGVQIFSLLLANPHVLKPLADICGAAPKFADRLARSPRTLDVILDPGFFDRMPGQDELEPILQRRLAHAGDYEAELDATRRFAGEQVFRAAVQILEGGVSVNAAGEAFSAIAETAIRCLVPAVERELARTAGRIDGGQFAIVALGKLGGREMTAASDLDLVFIYDAPPDVERPVSAKPISAPHYYARLAQRLIAALTAHTSEGGLYDVDMRLRPSGNKGPAAVSLESFERYHAREAWTWERMALTRARVVAAPEELGRKIEGAISAALCAPADPEALKRDVREMREKLAAQFPSQSHWDLKFANGGLVDIEFAAQFLQLRGRRAETLHTNTATALRLLQRTGAVLSEVSSVLIDAANFQQALLQALRIALAGEFDPGHAPPGLKSLLARTAGEPDFAALERRLLALQAAAHGAFERLLFD